MFHCPFVTKWTSSTLECRLFPELIWKKILTALNDITQDPAALPGSDPLWTNISVTLRPSPVPSFPATALVNTSISSHAVINNFLNLGSLNASYKVQVLPLPAANDKTGVNSLMGTLKLQISVGLSDYTAIRWLVQSPLIGMLLHMVQRGRT